MLKENKCDKMCSLFWKVQIFLALSLISCVTPGLTTKPYLCVKWGNTTYLSESWRLKETKYTKTLNNDQNIGAQLF